MIFPPWILNFLTLIYVLYFSGRDENDGRFVATYTTRTIISVSTSTTTVPYHCLSTVHTDVCSKRRRRHIPLSEEIAAAEDNR